MDSTLTKEEVIAKYREVENNRLKKLKKAAEANEGYSE